MRQRGGSRAGTAAHLLEQRQQHLVGGCYSHGFVQPLYHCAGVVDNGLRIVAVQAFSDTKVCVGAFQGVGERLFRIHQARLPLVIIGENRRHEFTIHVGEAVLGGVQRGQARKRDGIRLRAGQGEHGQTVGEIMGAARSCGKEFRGLLVAFQHGVGRHVVHRGEEGDERHEQGELAHAASKNERAPPPPAAFEIVGDVRHDGVGDGVPKCFDAQNDTQNERMDAHGHDHQTLQDEEELIGDTVFDVAKGVQKDFFGGGVRDIVAGLRSGRCRCGWRLRLRGWGGLVYFSTHGAWECGGDAGRGVWLRARAAAMVDVPPRRLCPCRAADGLRPWSPSGFWLRCCADTAPDMLFVPHRRGGRGR